MDNYFATTMQPQKKKADVFAMVVGAILALGFLIPTISFTIGFFADLGYFIDNFKFEYGFSFELLLDAIMMPAVSLLEILGFFLFALYCGLTVIMKGKKLRILFILGFVLMFITYSWWFIDDVWYMIKSADWLFDYGMSDFCYNLFWTLFYFFGGAGAFVGIICGIFKKKAPSVVFGIISVILLALALCSYIVGKVYPLIMDWWSFGFVSFIQYTVPTIVSFISMAGVLLLLRPTKKQ